MSDTRLTFGVATPIVSSAFHSAGRSRLRDMGQREILLVADADFAEGISLGKIGDRIHLVGGGVAGGPPTGFSDSTTMA